MANRIMMQARYSKLVQDLLQSAADEGRIAEPYLTSDEAGEVYDACEEGVGVELIAEELIRDRIALAGGQ